MYRITVDGAVVHDDRSPDIDYMATSATLSWETNRSGTLTFTVPPNNNALSKGLLKKLKPEVVVTYWNKESVGTEIWSGRIMDTTEDFNRSMTCTCEGWLSVLCDSIVRPEDDITVPLVGTAIAKEFTKLIENHNKQMEPNKRFIVNILGFEKDEDDTDPSTSTTTQSPPKPSKTVHEVALEVIQGLWGNGDERRTKLVAAGYDYDEVQAEVDRMYADGEVEGAEVVAADTTTTDTSSSTTSDSSSVSAQTIIDTANAWMGATTGDATHKEIIDLYNSYTPLPRNMRMEYDYAWCDAFVSAVFIKAGAVDLLGGTECYVDSHIAIFNNKGIWHEDAKYKPKAGDLICFNWDGDGETDHIGIVESVTGDTIKTIEGNSGNPGKVANQTYTVGASVIRGYARPKYGSKDSSSSSSSSTYSNTLDYIMSNFINNEEVGGTIICRGHTITYMSDDYQETHPDALAQPIEFGRNLLDYSNAVDASEVYTCMIPVGKDGLLINGRKRTPTGKSTLYGLDISEQTVDFSKLKDVDFIITSVTKRSYDDPQFESVYQGCIQNAILIGAYKYSYAMSGPESRAEAERVVSILNKRHLDFPIFIDLEEDAQATLGTDTIRSIITEFEDVVVKAGYKFGIYCNKNWYENYIPADAKTKYDFWLASVPYDDNGTIVERLKPNYPECNMVGWQYSHNGSVTGVSGVPDLNQFYTDYSSASVARASGDYDDYIINEIGVELYGKIFRQVDFPDAQDVATLKTMAEAKLAKALISAITIEVSAFDLSLLDADISEITLGAITKVRSDPHKINENYICSAINLDLCNPANNTYTFGVNQKTLTKRYNRILNSLTGSYAGITNYYVQETAAASKVGVSYSVVGKRVQVQNIQFYCVDKTVYLSFSVKYKKLVGDTSSIIKFTEKYAPESQAYTTVYDTTTNKSYVMRITTDGQILIPSDKKIAVNDVVTGNFSWQIKEN